MNIVFRYIVKTIYSEKPMGNIKVHITNGLDLGVQNIIANLFTFRCVDQM
jgi:hypothetical protein